MGLFGRKQRAAPPLVDLAHRVLAERGVETSVEGDPADPATVRLVAQDGQVYLLENLAAQLRGETPDRQIAIAEEHFDRMLLAQREPAAEALSADDLRDRIRVRLLADDSADPTDLSYARPFAPGLVLALCLDNPTTVTTLSASTLPKLALGVDELFAIGQLRTDDEPVDDRSEIAPGVHVVEGESLFTASKAANLPALFGAAPYGTVFTVPNRHLLIAAPISGPESLAAVQSLAGVFAQLISSDPHHPGGLVSPHLLFSRNGAVSVVSGFDDETAAA
ncbi:hypothetical protein [Curtobacterium sp. VKM Ac-2922]|uniref:hypothetical protein n=1 Tax=Curtobacterium sp. VKM Ac-2922 TaxID=2929475 RepID=UPI001FB1ABC5|nr:hypothetical protein [Curtobacterium sp. VKM Ac-2922]MCJ1715735.1 hypothetical protein [Curtobacterium sp. VKM Ac-2922]